MTLAITYNRTARIQPTINKFKEREKKITQPTRGEALLCGMILHDAEKAMSLDHQLTFFQLGKSP